MDATLYIVCIVAIFAICEVAEKYIDYMNNKNGRL